MIGPWDHPLSLLLLRLLILIRTNTNTNTYTNTITITITHPPQKKKSVVISKRVYIDQLQYFLWRADNMFGPWDHPPKSVVISRRPGREQSISPPLTRRAP